VESAQIGEPSARSSTAKRPRSGSSGLSRYALLKASATVSPAGPTASMTARVHRTVAAAEVSHPLEDLQPQAYRRALPGQHALVVDDARRLGTMSLGQGRLTHLEPRRWPRSASFARPGPIRPLQSPPRWLRSSLRGFAFTLTLCTVAIAKPPRSSNAIFLAGRPLALGLLDLDLEQLDLVPEARCCARFCSSSRSSLTASSSRFPRDGLTNKIIAAKPTKAFGP